MACARSKPLQQSRHKTNQRSPEAPSTLSSDSESSKELFKFSDEFTGGRVDDFFEEVSSVGDTVSGICN